MFAIQEHRRDIPNFLRNIPSRHMDMGTEKAHKLFEHQLFDPHPKHPIFDHQKKKFMCLISWERTQKRNKNINFLGEIWGQKGAPNGPFLATKCLVYCFFFPALNGRPPIPPEGIRTQRLSLCSFFLPISNGQFGVVSF